MLEDDDSSPEEEAIEDNTEAAASFLRELKYLLVNPRRACARGLR